MSSTSTTSTLSSSVDLRLVWALLGGFVLVSLLISGVSRIKWIRHRKAADLLAASAGMEDADDGDGDGVGPTTPAASLAAFASALLSQREATATLFGRHQEAIRTQLDRLVAETEQVKALLAVRMSEDRGYVDAAIALLLAEMTAAASYRSRQRKREAEVEATHAALLKAADELVQGAGAQSQDAAAVAALKERGASYCALLSLVFRESERERQRVHHVSSSSSILGQEALSLLTAHAEVEAEAERQLHRALRAAFQLCENFRFDCLEQEVEAQAGSGRGGRPAATAAGVSRRMLQSVRRMHAELSRCMDRGAELTAQLQDARAMRAEDEAAALESLERQKKAVDDQQSRGIFAGLNPQLTDALTFFIQRAALQAKASGATRADHPTATSLPGSALQPSSSSSASQSPSLLLSVLSVDSPAAVFPSLRQPMGDAAALCPPFASFDAAAAGESGDGARAAVELSTLYSDWLSQSRMQDQLHLADVGRQMEVGRQLDLHPAGAPLSAEDEQLLEEAQEELITESSSHLRQLAAVADTNRVDEQKQAELVLQDLRRHEEQAAAKEAELRADALAPNGSELVPGDEDDERVRREREAGLELALQALQAELHEERCKAQLELQDIHARAESKLRTATAALTRQHNEQATAAMARYQALKAEVDGRATNASSVQVEGVDLAQLKAEVEQGDGPSAREAALRQFHTAALQELQRSHSQALRLLAESKDAQHKAELQQRREEWDEQQRQEQDEEDAEYQAKADAEADATTVAALRAQQAEERRKRERKAREEWKKIEAELKQRHKAEDDQQLADLRAVQALERSHEVEEQTAELLELRLTAQRQREEAALRSLLTPSNRPQARQLIGAVTANRHAQEMQALLRSQQKAAADDSARRLRAAHDELTHARRTVDELRRDGHISPDEATERLAALAVQYAPATVAARVFEAVSAASAEAVGRLQSAQLEEQKALMRSVFPDESFTSSEWSLQKLDLSAISAAHARQMQGEQEALRAEMEQLEREEQEQVRLAHEDRQQRLAELEDRLRTENSLVHAQFAAQLRTANEEHTERIRQMEDELQRTLDNAGSDAERSVLMAEMRPQIEEERAQHVALLSSAAAQFEAELAVRNEAERVQLRRQLDEEITSAMKEARKEKEDRQRARLQDAEQRAAQTRKATAEAVHALIERGKAYRRTKQKGMRVAARQIMRMHGRAAPTTQPALTSATTATDGGAAPSAQLASIEALLLRLQRVQPAEAAQSTAAPLLVSTSASPIAVDAKELGARAVATVAAVRRLLAAVQTELRYLGERVTVRITRSAPSTAVPPSTALPATGLPQAHLVTLGSDHSVLWLWWNEATPLSAYLLSALYRLAGAAAGEEEADSAVFHARLHRLQALLLQRTLSPPSCAESVDDLARELLSPGEKLATPEEALEAVDAWTAQLAERLNGWPDAAPNAKQPNAQQRRVEREEVQRLLDCIDATQRRQARGE